MWRITQLRVVDFKSYRGEHVLTNFRNFHAIIGPNGAGKSNLMDAISFVLGVRTSLLRGTKMEDLIYRNAAMDSPPRSAEVELVLQTTAGQRRVFKRTLEGKTSKYFVNGEQTQVGAYQEALRELKIDVKARNFLVFQGDVIQVAGRSPKELTKMIEIISGSEELAHEYEELRVKKDTAEEKTMTCFQKKKGMNAEKRQFKAMKEEAETYQRLETELVEKKRDLMLVDIQHFVKGMKLFRKEIDQKQHEIEEVMERKVEREAEYNTIVEQIQQKEDTQRELRKRMRKLNNEREKKKPMEGNVVASKKVWAEKMRRAEREAKELEAKLREETERVAELESAAAEKQARLTTLKEEGNLKLTSSQQAEFNTLEEQYLETNATGIAQLAVLKQSIQVDEVLLQNSATSETLRQRREQLVACESRLRRTEDALRTEEDGHEAVELDLRELRTTYRERQTTEVELTKQLKHVEETMSELRMQQKQSKYDVLREDTVEALKKAFPKAVFGTVRELYIAKKTSEAALIALAVGKYNDAVVVDDTATATGCLQYCRQRRIPVVFTFLCLRQLIPKDFYLLDDELLAFGASFVIDHLTCDDQFRVVFRQVLNNTVLVKTAEQARKIAFAPAYRRRYRIITSTGSVIERNALVTGGFMDTGKKRVRRGGEDELNKLITRRLELEESIKKLKEVTLRDVDEKELEAKAAQQRVEVLRRRVVESRAEQEHLQAEIRELQKHGGTDNVREVEERLTQNKRACAAIEERLAADQQRVFGALSLRCGVDNVYLLCGAEQRRQREVEMMEAMNELELLHERIAAERAGSGAARMAELTREMAARKEEGERILEKERELQQVLHDNAKRIEEANKELGGVIREVEALKKQQADAKRVFDGVAKEIRDRQLEQETARGKYSKLRVALEETVRRARLEQVDLPHTDTVMAEPSQITMLVESQTQHEIPEYDFSSISGYKTGNQKAYLSTRQALDEEIQRVEVKINALTPNMKAIDQFNGIVDQLKTFNDTFDEVRKEAKTAKDAFQAVRAARTQRFMEAYQVIAKNIDEIYKDLTRSARNQLGGTAYLSLENPDEPYLAGLKFSAMPPTKRFHDLEQLSGGEKTIAALALLFAIQSYNPSPFFILDEIDDALDVPNILHVVHYIEARRHDVQFVVISLKDTLYERAEALVGVAGDAQRQSSVTYSLDLTEYPLT